MQTPAPKPPKLPWNLLRIFFRWHYRLGLIALPLVALLALTGIVLNHTMDLKLHKATIESVGLRQWYGLPPTTEGVEELVTWDRVLLDLHTGRFFGSAGPYVMDAAAILLLVVASSGVYNWFKRIKKW